MNRLQSCHSGKPQPSDKICISLDCTASSPYICDKCQESHQHNGMISAVRISRIQDIYQKIRQTQTWAAETRKNLESIKESIVQTIDQFLSDLEQTLGPSTVHAQELKLYLDGDGKGVFGQLWSQAKQKLKFCESVETQVGERKLKQLETKLNCIACLPENKQSEKMDSMLNEQSQFLERFANIFSYLNISLKSKISNAIVEQIQELKPTSRPAQKLTAKLYQICNELDRALEVYNKMQAQRSLDLQITAQKALILKKCKRYQEAYDELTILTDLIRDRGVDNDEFYHFQRGQVCRQLGRLEEAQREFAFCQNKTGVIRWKLDREIGHLRLQQRKHQEAATFYQRVLEHKEIGTDEIIEINQCLLECAQVLNNNPLAIQCLTVLFKHNPSQLEYLFKRARCYHQQKQHQKAAQDYSVAIKSAPKIPGLYYNRAVELIYMGESESSIPDLKQAIELDPNFKQAVHLLANTCFDLLMRKKNNPDVAEHLRNLAANTYGYALNFYPNNHSIWCNLGALEADRNFQKAYDCFCKSVQISPTHLPSQLGKIKTAIKLHKDSKSVLSDVENLIRSGDKSASTFLIKASLEEDLHLYGQALQSVDSALAIEPDLQEAVLFRRKLLQVRTERTDEIQNKDGVKEPTQQRAKQEASE